MKVGLIADTQGSYDIEALLRHVASAFKGVDEIWHAGDWGYPAVLDGLKTLGRLVVVNGNAPEDSNYPMTTEGPRGRWPVGLVPDLVAPRKRRGPGPGR